MRVRSRCKLLSPLGFSNLRNTGRLFYHRTRCHSSTIKDVQPKRSKLSSTTLLPVENEASLYVHVSVLDGLCEVVCKVNAVKKVKKTV